MKRPALLYLLFSGVMGVFILLAVLTAIVQVSAPIVSTEPVERGDIEKIVTPLATEDLLKQHVDLFSRAVRLEPAGYGSTVLETHTPEETNYDGGGSMTLVELWNISEKQEFTKLHEFSLPSDCASFDWDIFQGYLRVTEKTSPCEAFAKYRTFYYWLPSGELAKKLEWYTPGANLELQRGKVHETISLSFEPSACEQVEEGELLESLQQVLLTGLNIEQEGVETMFVPLETSLSVDCLPDYGGYRAPPGIFSPESTDGYDGGSDFIRFKIDARYLNEPLSAVLLFPGREEDPVFKIE